MKRHLPYVVRQAQLLTRKDNDLKKFMLDALRELSNFKTDHDRLSWLRQEVDRLIESSSEKSSCKKGCHYCCFHPISLSKVEAKDLMDSGRPFHQERYQKQQEHFEHNQEINYADRACIYLKDGQCSVYERRPFICRLSHVSSEPESCHYENDKTPIEHLPVTKAALLVGAFYMANPDVELMPLLIS